MTIRLKTRLLLVVCLVIACDSSILSDDQIKALNLANPYLQKSEASLNIAAKHNRIRRTSFHRNSPRNLSMLQDPADVIVAANDMMATQTLQVSLA